MRAVTLFAWAESCFMCAGEAAPKYAEKKTRSRDFRQPRASIVTPRGFEPLLLP